MKTELKFSSKLLGLALAVAMAFGALSIMPHTAQAAEGLAQEGGYYLIEDESDLFAFAKLVNDGAYNANAKLTADITMTGQNKPWTPIAPTNNVEYSYQGTFDGQGHTISKLYLYDEKVQCGGLIGHLSGGTVKNVKVSGGSITAVWVGAIAGLVSGGGTVASCENLNTTVSGSLAGGIVGDVSNATVLACSNTGAINATGTGGGGICGFLVGTVRGCWNVGDVTATNGAGGIVGWTNGKSATISHCYSEGVMSGLDDREGVIVGGSNDLRPNIDNCRYIWTSSGVVTSCGNVLDYRFDNVEETESELLSTGEAAHLLNQGLAGTGYQFYQNLDNDKTKDGRPVLNSTHGTVYQNYEPCVASPSYSNTAVTQSFHHSGITYETNGNTIREVCTNEVCTDKTKDLGSVTLKASDAYYTGSPIDATAENSLTHGGSYRLTYDGGSNTAPSAVGAHKVTLTVTFDTGSASVSSTFTINRKPVTITGMTAADREYNGERAVALSGGSIDGAVSNDDVAVDLSEAAGTVDDANAGQSKAVTIVGVKLSGTAAGNYVLAEQPSGVTVTINPKKVTITGVTAVDREYNGESDVALAGGSIDGAVSNDDVAVDLSEAAGIMADANAGQGKAVTVTGAKLVGTAASNYELTAQPIDVTVTINPKPATVTAKDISIYAGDKVPSFETPEKGVHYEVEGLLGGDELTFAPTLAYDESSDTSKAGEYAIIASGPEVNGNYAINYVAGTLTVSVRSYVPSAPPTTEVTIPISGDDETIHVEASVTGGKRPLTKSTSPTWTA